MATPIIVFGAFDRHNFGDLLFAHVAQAMLVQAGVDPARLRFAGLATRDLRPVGGHAVQALADLVARQADARACPQPHARPATLGHPPAVLVHAGGELLTCDAWQAAVMLQPPDGLQPLLRHFASRRTERRAWIRATVGTDEQVPYVVSRARLAAATRVLHLGVGGVALDRLGCDPRTEVLRKLAEADRVSVRDPTTRAHLARAGIDAQLIPDPAVMVAELFGGRIRARAPRAGAFAFGTHADRRHADSARMAGAGSNDTHTDGLFARGYLAVQFSAEFGDDATLDAIAAQLDDVCAATGLGVVLFRAGAAPWHDTLEPLHRVAARMRRTAAAQVFESLDLWSICALIAHSRGFCGSSLHGRIVAAACARPRVTLCRADTLRATTKHAAFVDAWECSVARSIVEPGHLAPAMLDALGAAPGALQARAAALVAAFRTGFADLFDGLLPITQRRA